jgi:hypothetical protein
METLLLPDSYGSDRGLSIWMRMDEDDRERLLSESEDALTDAVQIDAHADENDAEEIEEVVEEFYRRWKDAVDGFQ